MEGLWEEAGGERERRGVMKRVGGRGWEVFPYNREEAWWSEEFEVTGVTIDVRHVGVEATERILADVLERCDPSLAKQQHIAALRPISAHTLAAAREGLSTRTGSGHGTSTPALSPRLGARDAGRAQRPARPLRVLLYY